MEGSRMEDSDCVVVKINDGDLKGKVYRSDDNIVKYYSFTGIPYAASPVGELRFKEPQPPPKWTAVKDVSINKNDYFTQLDVQTNKLIGEEELLLNVFTPALPSKDVEKIPVMVYIHEGAHFWGSGAKKLHGPDVLVEKNIVYVTINYRLGMFGFMCLDMEDCAGNMGSKDQVLALKWVQNNIKYFNGDAKNVTIFGYSSGAAFVNLHLLSPMSKGLFKKAIIQSGTTISGWSICRNPIECALKVAKFMGFDSNKYDDLLNFLKKSDAKSIVEATIKALGDQTTFNLPFCTVIEKQFDKVTNFLTDEPIEIIKNGLYDTVPTMIGCSEREGLFIQSFFGALLDSIKAVDNGGIVNMICNTDQKQKDALRIYIKQSYNGSEEEKETQFIGDAVMSASCYKLAKLLAVLNRQVYVYHFSYMGDLNYLKHFGKLDKPLKRATHLDDLGYLMSADFLPKFTNDDDSLIRERMALMWTNFAKYGNPIPKATEILPMKWPPMTKSDYIVMNIDKNMEVLMNPFEKRRSLFEHLYNVYNFGTVKK